MLSSLPVSLSCASFKQFSMCKETTGRESLMSGRSTSERPQKNLMADVETPTLFLYFHLFLFSLSSQSVLLYGGSVFLFFFLLQVLTRLSIYTSIYTGHVRLGSYVEY